MLRVLYEGYALHRELTVSLGARRRGKWGWRLCDDGLALGVWVADDAGIGSS